MSQLTILYYSTGDCKENLRFRESCQNRGLRIKAYGSVEGMADAVKSCDSEYVMYANAEEVVAVRGERDVVDLLKPFTKPVIAGSRVPYADTVQRIESPTDMQFPNPVLIGGTQESMLIGMAITCDYGRNLSLDIYCNLFQPLAGEKLGVSLIIDPNVHLLQNADTGAFPCFVYGDEKQLQEFEEWIK